MSPGASHLSQLAPLISGGRKGPGLEGQEGHNGDSRETPIKRVVQSTRSASRASLPRSNKGTITNYFASPKIYSRAAEGGVVDGPVTRARSSRKESPDHRTPRSGVSQRGEITRASVKECLDSGPVGSRDSLQVPAQTSGSDADDDDDDEFVPGMPKGRFWLHRIEVQSTHYNDSELSSMSSSAKTRASKSLAQKQNTNQSSIDSFFNTPSPVKTTTKNAPKTAHKGATHTLPTRSLLLKRSLNVPASVVASTSKTTSRHNETANSPGAVSASSSVSIDDTAATPSQIVTPETQPTSLATTPEPTASAGTRELPKRSAKARRVPVIVTLSEDDDEGDTSDFSANFSEAISSESPSIESAIEEDDGSNDSDAESSMEPSTKRPKLSQSSKQASSSKAGVRNRFAVESSGDSDLASSSSESSKAGISKTAKKDASEVNSSRKAGPLTKGSQTQSKKTNKPKAKASEELDLLDDSEESGDEVKKAKKSSNTHKDTFQYKVGIDRALPPISNNTEIFSDMMGNALDNGLLDALQHLGNGKIRVATMCSGTESPILAAHLFSEDLRRRDLGLSLNIDHLFSAEIVPFKQAYIERNFSPPIIFRDIRELGIEGVTEATTAYGSKVRIPEGVDLLIAGFSCVDFSALNNRKKKLEDGGESGDTLTAILKYAERYRPKIMILENVKGAPWEKIQVERMPSIRYSAAFSNKIDTKHYYLPQTRQRGYMICVDQDICEELGENPHELAATAMKNMVNLQRPASSPIQAFLLDDDDPRVIQSRAQHAHGGRDTSSRRNDIDWTRCYGRHQDIRTDLALGQRRPIMQWEEGGTCYPRDSMWIDYFRGQVERVWDVIDIFSLLNLKRGFDFEFKARILDLSQNVDRGYDKTSAGLTPCVTPSGMPYSTFDGRPLTAHECLALHGLPINKLQLTRETQAMLQDLAGNAMSSTVAGAAIFAALISAFRLLNSGNDCMEIDSTRVLPRTCESEHLRAYDCDIAVYTPMSVSEAKKHAGNSAQLCLCEGHTMNKPVQMQKCILCGHTSCAKCGGNPTHKYKAIKTQVTEKRMLPLSFEKLVKQSLPMRITVAGITTDDINTLIPSVTGSNASRRETRQRLVDRFIKAFNSHYRFHRIKRSVTWTIYYDSEDGRLELVLGPTLAEWRLFAKPLSSEPGDSQVRKMLLQPIARMRPNNDSSDLLKGAWQLAIMEKYSFDAEIAGYGDLIPSYEASQGLADFLNIETFSGFSISIDEESAKHLELNISGTYESLPNCGSAMRSLHKRKETVGTSENVYMFFDPHPINEPKYDNWVFSNNHDRVRYGEARPIFARIDSTWRQPQIERIEDRNIPEIVKYRVAGRDKLLSEAELRRPTSVTFYSDCQWTDIPQVKLQPIGGSETATFKRISSDFSIKASSQSCQSGHVILQCEAPLPNDDNFEWKGQGIMEIDQINQMDFFAAFLWLLEKVRMFPALDDWQVPTGTAVELCEECAPKPPSLKWTLGKDNKLVPFEDSREALPFERAIKTRPQPLVVLADIDRSGYTQIRLAINPETLMHRALAKLPGSDNSKAEVSWRLLTDYIPPTKASLPPLKIPSNENDGMAKQPPGFRKPLRPEQLESLKWMLGQERSDIPPFIEEEVEEATIPQIGWRLEGRASKPVVVRGGVLADEVGFGKTITTLALVASHRERDREAAKVSASSRIPVKATLILVPGHITGQWHDATHDFLPHNGYKVIVIKNIPALNKVTVQDFQTADIIIISWELLKGDPYFFRVAEFAGILELPVSVSVRAEAAWYAHAMEKVLHHTAALQKDGKSLKAIIDESLKDSEEQAHDQETFVPSKRLRGKAYQDAKVSKDIKAAGRKRAANEISGEQETKKARSKGTGLNAFESLKHRTDSFGLTEMARGKKYWTSMKGPLLEMFEFSRVVVDEYTYVQGKESIIMCGLQAKSRWVLSGTPPMEDFMDVKSISKFLGINLGVDDLTAGVTKTANIKALSKDRTESEEFRFLTHELSAEWHENRWKVAQRFMSQFVRQNKAKIGALPKSTHIMPVRQPAAERGLYLELVQLLAATNFNLRKSRANADNDRVRRIREIIGSSQSAAEALLKCASHFTLDEVNDTAANATQACDVIVTVRERQYQKLRKAFKSKLKQTEWLQRTHPEPCLQYSNWKKGIDNNNLDDIETATEIKSLYEAAEEKFKMEHGSLFYITAAERAKDKNNEDERRSMPEPGNTHLMELRNRTADLGNLRKELLARKRGLRFFKNVRLLQQLFHKFDEQTAEGSCTCSVCGTTRESSKDFFVQTLCGHIMCELCFSRRTPESTCGAEGCGAVNKDYQVLPSHELGSEEQHSGKHYGKKIENLISLIQNIDETEQVLVFVQFPDLLDRVSRAFEDHRISFEELSNSKQQSAKLEAFQKGDKKHGMKKKQVLVLNLGDASAAGSNLTGANHVIFVSPYLAERQQTYESQMTQAIGRAVRFGQTKHVHVYQFLTLNTIDVDTLQARSHGRILKTVADDVAEPLPFPGFLASGLALRQPLPGDAPQFGSMVSGAVEVGESDDE